MTPLVLVFGNPFCSLGDLLLKPTVSPTLRSPQLSRGNHPQLRESVLQLVESVTIGYIWHREAFTLSVTAPSEGALEPHLIGEQVFGGNVADEWFVCYLLFTITSTFTE